MPQLAGRDSGNSLRNRRREGAGGAASRHGHGFWAGALAEAAPGSPPIERLVAAGACAPLAVARMRSRGEGRR
eukprot:CAMPEP_0170358686 /NCGR_PEP_ID=MMETSP0117_2-20130122/2356_1 /TAXON_ID=400756 /ORGANISM="Durinskia baltica, Strain CSIRO CS-38" /LENGTH=72 /DNA_ID=CAMNT_0010612903 /DNA_START=40 /DNA_END=254 /DNA_ORIENTATION=+